MVKCVVSGCPNRVLNCNRGVLNRTQKRFFPFPKDPARVKVWLAALRETDKQDATEQHLICEEHFLPEDISANGVNSDAIPIMPPYLDGPLGIINPWGAEWSEEEDQWGPVGGDDEEEEDDEEEGGDDAAQVGPPPSPPRPPQQGSSQTLHIPSETKTSSLDLQSKEKTRIKKQSCRNDASLVLLTRRFLELMLVAPDSCVDLHQVATVLQTRKCHIYDIISILEGVSVVQRTARRVKWIGHSPISSFLWKNEETFQKELENLKLVENTLDGLIKNCAQQLFDMTDDKANAMAAYITHEDTSRLASFSEQTVILVKAPEETKLEVPAPREDNIKIHLKSSRGPITVLTCDIGTGGVRVKEEMSGCFMTLEESRIQTQTLHTDSNGC
ncbi:transcription factor E2F2 [Dunckerocampus dactyliophorus]|uniref:transcription factor E2F2 n=1 Tax=Dunckerocampus dactyliophorus TaxID=161453 RepID=UPI002406240A|nr:transcription factor E2F2 [Dunckerocampus dactyliophorus]